MSVLTKAEVIVLADSALSEDVTLVACTRRTAEALAAIATHDHRIRRVQQGHDDDPTVEFTCRREAAADVLHKAEARRARPTPATSERPT